MRRTHPALIPDLLTFSRLGVAVLVVPVAWSLDLELTGILVSAAWLTDFLDGRLARRSNVEGRMGRWDLPIDTLVGTGLLIGLTGAGKIPVVVAVAAIVGLGGWFLTGNQTASMLLQLAGYLPLFGILLSERPTAWWLPFLTALLIGVLDWRRLLTINIPAFLRGLVGRTPSQWGRLE
ncbi:MAG: CDP-alcohol phosphatidyltransferase family protein [Acidimicrobiia bacterium]